MKKNDASSRAEARDYEETQSYRGQMADAWAQATDAWAEIERLKADNKRAWILHTEEESRRYAAETELERLKAALAVAEPWPLVDVLQVLTSAANHLLHDHDCDHMGYESIVHACSAARQIKAAIEAASGRRRRENE